MSPEPDGFAYFTSVAVSPVVIPETGPDMPRNKPMEQFFSHIIGLLVAAVVVSAMVTTFYLTSPQRATNQVASLSVAELKEIVRSLDGRGVPPNGPKKNRLLAALLQLGNGDSEIEQRVHALSLSQVHLQNEIGAAARVSLKKLGPKTFPTLQEMLESDDRRTVGRACSSIYLLGESASSFAPKLIQMVETGDRFRVAAGLLGLETMGTHSLQALEVMDSIILDAHFMNQVSITGEGLRSGNSLSSHLGRYRAGGHWTSGRRGHCQFAGRACRSSSTNR